MIIYEVICEHIIHICLSGFTSISRVLVLKHEQMCASQLSVQVHVSQFEGSVSGAAAPAAVQQVALTCQVPGASQLDPSDPPLCDPLVSVE